jgi:hypothetical protein
LPRDKLTRANLRRSAALLRWQEGAALDEKVRLVQAISLVGERLAQMLLAEKKLSSTDENELEQWLRQMANEVLEEKGWEG